jgi:hypothetical protein
MLEALRQTIRRNPRNLHTVRRVALPQANMWSRPNFTLILSKRLLLHEDFFVHWLQSVHWL